MGRGIISINLMGGLGNVMFQIATMEYLSKVFDIDVCYTNVDTWLDDLITNYYWETHAEDYLKAFPNLDLYKNHNKRFIAKRRAEVVFRYTALAPEDGDLFIGYFQSEMNFTDREYVKNLFKPSEEIINKVATYDNLFEGITCSLNVRRRNYLNFKEIHPPCSLDYYKKAIGTIRNYGVDKFIVFTDDMNWCKNNFNGDEFVFVEDIDYVELFLIAKCHHHIIANSSFSWWGAWLGEEVESKIIAPQKWFGSFLPEDHAADIIPERWKKI